MENLIIRTPLIPFGCSRDASLACEIYLKPESLQMLGSYKIRGIVNVIKEADPAILKHGLSAASAGNMAQAIAYMAKTLQIPSKIFIPDSAPTIKKENILKLGAQLIEMPYQAVWEIVRNNLPPEQKGVFVHPVYNASLIKGYGTIAEEIIEDLPEVDAIIIPFGVGGLSIGVATALQKLKKDISIYTCEPETASPMKKSLEANSPCSMTRLASFVDAIGTPEVLPEVYKILKPLLKDSLVISIADIKKALKLLLLQTKLVCEGAAACSLAAGLYLAERNVYRKIVCILSGGNISNEVLLDILRE